MNKRMFKYMIMVYFLIATLIGEYVPQRDANGALSSKQCWGSTGTCWCQYSTDRKHFRIADDRDCPNGPI